MALSGFVRRNFWLWMIPLLLTAGAVIWICGFIWFCNQIPRQIIDPLTKTDAIVVLTGGADRLRTGIDLLTNHRSRALFISGVAPRIEIRQVLHPLGETMKDISCCIELGHQASDTAGNAAETARWMESHGFVSLRLVTANYHMPRSLAEFRRMMPNVKLVSHPVFPPSVRMHSWWQWPGTTILLASEFNKYLLSIAWSVKVEKT